MDEPNTSCEKFLQKYFPASEHNAYGVIPLLGLVASFFTAGLCVQILVQNVMSRVLIHYIDPAEVSVGWFLVLFCLGLCVFALVQSLWGFHAEHIELLHLWLISKCIELLLNISWILFVLVIYACVDWLTIFAIFNSVFTVVLLRMGHVKYKDLKEIIENNTSVDKKPLCDKLSVI